MRSALKLLAVATVLLTSTFAAAVGEAKTTTSCPNPTTTTANFDKLPTNTAVPNGYAGSFWTGFTVQESLNQYTVNAKSKPNVALANAEGSNIGLAVGGVIMELLSFSFACVAYPPGGSGALLPSDCGLQVISQSSTPLLGLQLKGTYAYKVDYDKYNQGYAANMTKVTTNLQGSYFYFNLVSGSSSTMLMLDNVVLSQQNDAC